MRRRKIEGDKEVDLAALIDIMSNMLFFLITTVSLIQLKTLNASVPALSAGGVSTGKAVDVSVEVRADGFVLNATGAPANGGPFNEIKGLQIPRLSDKSLDVGTLTDELWKVKSAAPETKNVMIFPEDGVPFEDVVAAMDATREMKSKADPNKRIPLFTRPVLSELVKADAPAAPAAPAAPPK